MSRINRYNFDKFFEHHLNIDSKTLCIFGDVDEVMSGNAIKGLHILDNLPNNNEITILLNSTGGDVYEGMAIYDSIMSCKCHVVIKVFGQAFSMGAILFQSADERLVSPNARLMIHYGSLSLDDAVKNTYRWTDEAKKLDRQFEDIILEKIKNKHPKYNRTKVQSLLQFDTILDATESINLGLADGFIK